ncbi:MAG: DUF3275 family protein [Pseudomonadota bacterium]
MIKLSGVLTIKSIDGRNGRFCVGRLVTGLGEFTVKDTLLEQYDPGKYEGDFGISRIYPYSYFANGGVRVEIRACVESIALAGIERLTPEEERMTAAEPDPLDEAPTEARQVSAGAGTSQEDSAKTGGSIGGMGNPDVDLFGALWPLGDEVKLDPTVDRALFRSQHDRLRALGYRFQAVGQIWVKRAAGTE